MDELLNTSNSPELGLIKKQIIALLMKGMITLPPRHERVLRMRFGLDGGEAKGLKEIGELLNLGSERVRQIEMNALRRLATRGRRLKPEFCGMLAD